MSDPVWVRAASTAEIDEAGGLLGRSVCGVAIALYGVGGEYFATANTCTHGQASLSEGYLEGFLIECPLHQGLFDIRTGEPKGPPCTKPVRTMPVRRQGEDLLISLDCREEGSMSVIQTSGATEHISD